MFGDPVYTTCFWIDLVDMFLLFIGAMGVIYMLALSLAEVKRQQGRQKKADDTLLKLHILMCCTLTLAYLQDYTVVEVTRIFPNWKHNPHYNAVM
jgi:hypothetical protein